MVDAGVWFALGAMLCWGVGDFLIQRTVRRTGDIEALALIGVVGSVGLLPWVIPLLSKLVSTQNLLLLLWLGVLAFVAALLNFEALKVGKLSVIEVLLEFELPVAIVLGIVFFGEALSAHQALIMAAIFVGILLVAAEKLEWRRGLERGAVLAVFAAVVMGATDFLTAASAKDISPVLAIWAPWVVFTAMSMYVIAKRGGLRGFWAHAKANRSLVVGMGVFDTAAWLFYALGLARQELSLTTAISESYPAIALLLGMLINREHILSHQGIGAGIALAGSVALAAGI